MPGGGPHGERAELARRLYERGRWELGPDFDDLHPDTREAYARAVDAAAAEAHPRRAARNLWLAESRTGDGRNVNGFERGLRPDAETRASIKDAYAVLSAAA